VKLAGEVAVITGGASGIGRGTALAMARAGANIVVHGMEAELIEPAVELMRQHGIEAWGMAADLSRTEEMDRLATDVLERGPHLDILVNNAGSARRRAHFWEISHEDAEWTMNVNWGATFVLSQHVARQMMERKIRGRIVNISTIGAHYNHRDALVYNAAKAAIEATTRNMAYELGPYGITVNCVVPGAISERPGSTFDPVRAAPYIRHIPVGRIGRAEDISAVVRFFCLPESSFISGEALLVSGAHDTYLPEF